MREKVTTWYGYKLRLLVDAEYEFLVAFNVTAAFRAEITQAHLLVEAVEKIKTADLRNCRGS